jgi:hypothetical protein
MNFCATLRSAVARLREKNTKNENKKISKEKKSQSRYVSHMRGGAFIQLIAVEVWTSV